MLLPHLNELSTIVYSDEAIVTMHNGHCIVTFLAFRDFSFPVCEEWFTQSLHTHSSNFSGDMIQQTAEVVWCSPDYDA